MRIRKTETGHTYEMRQDEVMLTNLAYTVLDQDCRQSPRQFDPDGNLGPVDLRVMIDGPAPHPSDRHVFPLKWFSAHVLGYEPAFSEAAPPRVAGFLQQVYAGAAWRLFRPEDRLVREEVRLPAQLPFATPAPDEFVLRPLDESKTAIAERFNNIHNQLSWFIEGPSYAESVHRGVPLIKQ